MIEDKIGHTYYVILIFQLSRMNFFLVHLSLADILTTLLTLVPEIAWTLTLPAFWGGPMICKFIKFVQVRRNKNCKMQDRGEGFQFFSWFTPSLKQVCEKTLTSLYQDFKYV